MSELQLPFSEACERNRAPILEVLRDAFRDAKQVLEIGSGTGQHALFFAAALPALQWQPTEAALNLPGLSARLELAAPPNRRAPLLLDVGQSPWPAGPSEGIRWDAAFSANTLHIMSAPLVERFFTGVGTTLTPRARLAVYGPFRYAGRFTTESNARFDASLRARDPASGLRDVEWLLGLAAGAGFGLIADHAMPSNNQLLVWQRG